MPSATQPAIVWFRDDLRLSDQPALSAAIETGAPVLCIYVFDEESDDLRPLGGASRWWLHHSLAALAGSLAKIGGRLDILRGAAGPLVTALAKAADAQSVLWTRRYGGAEIAATGRRKPSWPRRASPCALSMANCCTNHGSANQGRRILPGLLAVLARGHARPAPAPHCRRPSKSSARRGPATRPRACRSAISPCCRPSPIGRAASARHGPPARPARRSGSTDFLEHAAR